MAIRYWTIMKNYRSGGIMKNKPKSACRFMSKRMFDTYSLFNAEKVWQNRNK